MQEHDRRIMTESMGCVGFLTALLRLNELKTIPADEISASMRRSDQTRMNQAAKNSKQYFHQILLLMKLPEVFIIGTSVAPFLLLFPLNKQTPPVINWSS